MCTILINQPIAISSGGAGTPTTSITVTGSTSNCSCTNVKVTIECLGSTGSSFLNVPVSSSGNFTATFSGSNIPACYCEKQIKITVICQYLDNPPTVQIQMFTIHCQPECCLLFDPKFIIGDCIDGKRLVIFDIGFNVPDERCLPYEFYLDFGDGYSSPNQQPFTFGANNFHETHLYSPGNYTAVLHYVTHSNCPPLSIQIIVPPCDLNCCPNAVAVITSEIENKLCISNNATQPVKIDAVITPTPQPNCPTNIQAEMWIDNQFVASGSGSSTFTISYQGNYLCGDHIVTIKYPGSNCPDTGGIFCVPVCESPTCYAIRFFLFEPAATIAIISWILTICNYLLSSYSGPNLAIINSVKLPLLILAIVATVAWIIFFIMWRLTPCRITCKKCRCLLISWEVALASFLGFSFLSKSSIMMLYSWLSNIMAPVYAIIILVIIFLILIIIILLLFFAWVAKCCPTKCEKWVRFFEALLVCGVAFALIDAVIDNATVSSISNTPYSKIFWIFQESWVRAMWASILATVLYYMIIACFSRKK